MSFLPFLSPRPPPHPQDGVHRSLMPLHSPSSSFSHFPFFPIFPFPFHGPPTQDPAHRSLIPLVEGALAIMRLSCEKYFVLMAIYASYLLFRGTPLPARLIIKLVARVCGVFQKVGPGCGVFGNVFQKVGPGCGMLVF